MFISLLLLCCSCLAFFSFGSMLPKNASQELHTLFDEYAQWRIADSPEYATYIDIHDHDALLNDLSEAAFLDRLHKSQEFLKRAKNLQPSITEDSDIVNLKVLIYELETYINFYDLKGIYLPLNYNSGPHVSFIRLLQRMPLNTLSDYEVLIQRMEKLPVQIDQIIELMKAGVRNNITYHEVSMKNLNDSIGKYIVKDPNESPFYDFFKTGFPETFTSDQIAELQKKAKEVITLKVSSAFERLLEYIEKEYVTRENIAVSSIRKGEEFYNALICFQASTNSTAEEIHNIGLSEVQRIESEMLKVIQTMEEGSNMTLREFSTMIRDDPQNHFNTSDELVAAYKDIIFNRINPQLLRIFTNLPELPVTVEEDTTPLSSGAYYRMGSEDGSKPGTFFVRTYYLDSQPKSRMMSLALHEANPGHHFQISLMRKNPDFPSFRKNREYGLTAISPSRFPFYNSYVEGWALYAESLGFDMDLYEDPLERFGHYNEEIYRAVRLVVDTGIHALGWTKEEAINYMFNHSSLTKTSVENQIDRYITFPGQALGYKIGQLKIRKQRNEAEKILGSKFDLKQFHDVVLNSVGPMEIVEEEVQKWIAKKAQEEITKAEE